jgi:2-hydroxy-6-oxonona-2,4-dienedioate hydrolase
MEPAVLTVVTALAALAAGVALLCWRDLAHHRARISGRSRSIDTDYGPLEYAETGEGAPLLIVHGAGGGFDQGLDLAGPIAGMPGVRLIAPSRFGYLGSPLPANASVAMQADAYAALLDALGIARAAVIGFSAGAPSCLAFAARHPARCQALVLCVPAGRLPSGLPDYARALLQTQFHSDVLAWATVKLLPLLPDTLQRASTGIPSAVLRAASPDERARVRRLLDHMLPTGVRRDGLRFDMTTLMAPPPAPLARISCPVLTISAEDDAFGTATRAREIAADVADGRVIIYPRGGHALIGVQAEAVKEITAFLRAAAQHTPR